MKYISAILLSCVMTMSYGQFDHQAVFPDQEGDALMTLLVDEYKVLKELSYSKARDTMFSKVDAVDDMLTGIYTGMTLFLDPNLDPTQAVFMNGMDNGINTEHSYPRSKGAENGNARADMHHLYPSRIKTNNARGSRKFAEINDANTQTWYRDMQELSSIPSSNIDEYSELTADAFEPRESVKGDIARSVMYFFTMYRQQAMSADPNYFESMRETLCDWHYLDPVDEVEWQRTWKIAEYQEGKANPFVLDCSLASRMYCNTISEQCQIVDVEETDLLDWSISPNPVNDLLFIEAEHVDGLYVLDVLGQMQISKSTQDQQLDVSHLNAGVYFLVVQSGKQIRTFTFVKN